MDPLNQGDAGLLLPDLNDGQEQEHVDDPAANDEDDAMDEDGHPEAPAPGPAPMPVGPTATPLAPVANKEKFGNVKVDKFDAVKHAAVVVEWLLQVTLVFQLNGYAQALWGIYLLTLLPMDTLRLVLANLGLQLTSVPDPSICTWEAVSNALKAVCCIAEDTDQSRLYTIMRYKVQDSIPGRYKKLLEEMEQLFLKLHEPLSTQSKIFNICLKIPHEFRAKFQYNNGKPWTTFEEFKSNLMALAPLLEQDLSRTQSNSNKSKPGKPGKPQHKEGNNRPFKKSRFTRSTPSSGNDTIQTVNHGEGSSRVNCDQCGKQGHRSFWKDRSTGEWICPQKKAQHKGDFKPKKP